MGLDPYPTEEELKKIENWKDDWPTLMDYVESLWWAADWGWEQSGNSYCISTGGWSGNEDIIAALQDNFIFWAMFFEAHRVGGHFLFNIAQEDLALCEACDGTGFLWKPAGRDEEGRNEG